MNSQRHRQYARLNCNTIMPVVGGCPIRGDRARSKRFTSRAWRGAGRAGGEIRDRAVNWPFFVAFPKTVVLSLFQTLSGFSPTEPSIPPILHYFAKFQPRKGGSRCATPRTILSAQYPKPPPSFRPVNNHPRNTQFLKHPIFGILPNKKSS